MAATIPLDLKVTGKVILASFLFFFPSAFLLIYPKPFTIPSASYDITVYVLRKEGHVGIAEQVSQSDGIFQAVKQEFTIKLLEGCSAPLLAAAAHEAWVLIDYKYKHF